MRCWVSTAKSARLFCNKLPTVYWMSIREVAEHGVFWYCEECLKLDYKIYSMIFPPKKDIF